MKIKYSTIKTQYYLNVRIVNSIFHSNWVSISQCFQLWRISNPFVRDSPINHFVATGSQICNVKFFWKSKSRRVDTSIYARFPSHWERIDQFARRPVRELTSPRIDWPRIGFCRWIVQLHTKKQTLWPHMVKLMPDFQRSVSVAVSRCRKNCVRTLQAFYAGACARQ